MNEKFGYQIKALLANTNKHLEEASLRWHRVNTLRNALRIALEGKNEPLMFILAAELKLRTRTVRQSIKPKRKIGFK